MVDSTWGSPAAGTRSEDRTGSAAPVCKPNPVDLGNSLRDSGCCKPRDNPADSAAVGSLGDRLCTAEVQDLP